MIPPISHSVEQTDTPRFLQTGKKKGNDTFVFTYYARLLCLHQIIDIFLKKKKKKLGLINEFTLDFLFFVELRLLTEILHKFEILLIQPDCVS